MFIKTILEEFKSSDKSFVRLSVNNKSFIIHLYMKEEEIKAHYVVFREAKPKGKTKEERVKQLKEAVRKNPNRAFIEPNGEVLGILCFKALDINSLPKNVDKYQFMNAKESYEWLLLKSIGL